MKINFLVGSLDYFNSYAFIYPIYNSLNITSNKHQIDISYVENNSNYDLIFIDSKYFYKNFLQNNFEVVSNILRNMKKKCKKLIYCDNEASLFINSNIYKHVDYYLKSKLPSDKNYYFKKYYGLRIYTDFYNEKFNITDKNENYSYILNEAQISKNILGWNNGICDYSLYSNYKRKVFSYTNFKFILNFKVKKSKKTKRLSARIGQTYDRETINFQRDYLIKNLKSFVQTNRVNKKEYFKEISESYSSLSPFGWGEICYRDFEIFLNESMLIKPSMDHIQTWPNYYLDKETYIKFKWDFSDFDKIINLIDNKDYCSHIARNGHKYFMNFFNDDGKKLFSDYFENILNKIIS